MLAFRQICAPKIQNRTNFLGPFDRMLAVRQGFAKIKWPVLSFKNSCWGTADPGNGLEILRGGGCCKR